jgi:hypothetical protein
MALCKVCVELHFIFYIAPTGYTTIDLNFYGNVTKGKTQWLIFYVFFDGKFTGNFDGKF